MTPPETSDQGNMVSQRQGEWVLVPREGLEKILRAGVGIDDIAIAAAPPAEPRADEGGSAQSQPIFGSVPLPTREAEEPAAVIRHMVQRFLGWRLPEDFHPDAGISFKAEFNENSRWPMKHEPVGTNLFDATQAEAMVRHMLDGLPLALSTEAERAAATPPDEVTEDAIRVRAKQGVLLAGWRPGDRPGLHSVIELMVQFGMNLTAYPETSRCSHPECCCDWDEICSAAVRAGRPAESRLSGRQGSEANTSEGNPATDENQ